MVARVLQTNRIYSLSVWDTSEGSGWDIRDLHITFDISKMSDNSKKDNTATIDIYNLSKEKQRFLEKSYISAVLEVGYVGTGLKRLFAGKVVDASTRSKEGDVITTLRIGAAYTELNHKTLSKLIPDGSTVKDVLEEVAEALGTSRNLITGVNCNNPVLDGYPISGTPKSVLNEVCNANKMEWSLDDDVLYVRDKGDSHTQNMESVVVISQASGLIERPYLTKSPDGKSKANKETKKSGLQFRCLLNPELVPGSLIKLEYEELTGHYRIDSIRAFGGWRDNNWYMDIKLTERVG